jgi:glutamate dehydrogenase (NAD(P)+)
MRIDCDSLLGYLEDIGKKAHPQPNVDELFSLENPRPSLTVDVTDSTGGRLGFLVIDTLIPGICSGGIRMASDVTQGEVAHLARAMTHKFAFKNSFIGGAKAGIAMSAAAPAEEKKEALKTFGQKLGPIMKALYSPGGDIGVGPDDLDVVKQGAGLPCGKTPGMYKGGFTTAFGVFLSVQCMAEKLAGRLDGCTIAVEGYGNVGRPLVRFLNEAGAKIVALSTIRGGLHNPKGLDLAQIEKLADQWGDRVVEKYENADKIDRTALFAIDASILIPGARAWSIHEKNAASVKARAVIPAANIPVTRGAANRLNEAGIVYIPEFVTTGGGIMGGQLYNRGFQEKDVLRIMTRTFRTKLTRLFDLADAHGITIEEQALRIAKENFLRGRQEAAYKKSRIRYYLFLIKKEKSILPMIHRTAGRLYHRLPQKPGLLKRLFKAPAMADVYRYTMNDVKYYPALPSRSKKRKNHRKA